MSKRIKRDSGLWTYLEKSGVLVNGTDEQIKAVRREYRKIYLCEYKQKQRSEKREFLVQLDRQDHTKISAGAKKHGVSISAFLRLAALAYIDRAYLIPRRDLVATLAGLLESCLNDVRAMATAKNHSVFALDEKYEAIETRIGALESDIKNLFFYPPLLEAAVSDAFRNDSALRERLRIIISNANSENSHPQET